MENYYAITRTGDNELQHWKYIKKKKVNGKWRYYYDIKDALGYDERQKAFEAIDKDNEAQKKILAYNKYREKHGTNLTPETHPDFFKRENAAYKHKWNTHVKSIRSIYKYYKTPLGKLDLIDDKIDAGRTYVSKFLNKLSKKYDSKTINKLSRKIKPKKEKITNVEKAWIKYYKEFDRLNPNREPFLK